MDELKDDNRACVRARVWGIKYEIKSTLGQLSPGRRAQLFGERRGRVPVSGEAELETFPDGRQCLVVRISDGEGTTVCLDFDPGAFGSQETVPPRAPRDGDQSNCCINRARPVWRRYARGRSGWIIDVPGQGKLSDSPVVACPYCGTRLMLGRIDP